MNLFDLRDKSLQGLSTAVESAAKTINDPSSTVPLEDVAKQLVFDIAKALSPNQDPNITINNLVNNGIDGKTELQLGAYAAIFKLGIEMAFSGSPGVSGNNQFSKELLGFLAPLGMNSLEQSVFSQGLDKNFRLWKHG